MSSAVRRAAPRLQRSKQHLRCVDRGHLEGCSPLELAVQGMRDKVVAELLQNAV
jgi:hypothetical protein